MNTAQNYDGKANFITPQVFLVNNPDLIGLDPSELYELLADRFRHSPVGYHSILDGVTLLRTLLPQPDQIVDCHYALLLKAGTVVNLVCLTRDESEPEPYLSPLKMNSRHLMEYIIDEEATAVLLASNRDTTNNVFTPQENAHIDDLRDSLEFFDVELLDWLVMTPQENSSWLELNGWDYSQEGIDRRVLDSAGVDPNYR